MGCALDQQRDRRGQRRRGEERQPRCREPRQPAAVDLRDVRHRRLERGGAPHDIRAEPQRVDPIAALVGVDRQSEDLVGDDPEPEAEQQHPVRARPTARSDEELRERDEQQDIDRRVGHRDEPPGLRARVHVVVRVDEEDPLDERDAAEDDERVEDRGAARLPAELAQNQQHAERRVGTVGLAYDITDDFDRGARLRIDQRE